MRLQPEYVKKIADRLLQAKHELAIAQAEYDRMFNSNAPTQAPLGEKSKSVREGTGRSRVLAYINDLPREAFDAARISQALELPLPTTRAILSALVTRGMIEKRGNGLYGANRISAFQISEAEEEPDEELVGA